MSNNINENNFVLAVKDTNKECSMKTYYCLLIVLSIIEFFIELFFLSHTLPKFKKGLIIFILILFLSIIYLLFSIYYLFKLKICFRTRKEILSKTNLNQIKFYTKTSKILMIIGSFVTTTYFLFIFYNICFNDKILPNCESDLFRIKNLDNILSLKSCQRNKCYNIKSNYKNEKYNNNYLCNINIGDYLVYNEDKNKIDCVNLPKDMKLSMYSSFNSFARFFKEQNNTISKLLFYFMMSCDYDMKKELYICNTLNKLNDDENSVTNIEIINDYKELDDDLKEKINDGNIGNKNENCISLVDFILSIILNLIIFFTLPIKVDIWFNESRRFEIIKKQIHPHRLRVNNIEQNDNNNNYNNLDVFSVSTDDNSSNKSSSSDSSMSDNGPGGNNILEAIIQN